MKRKLLLTSIAAAGLFVGAARAQIDISSIGSNVYTQNFASLSGGTWSDNSTLTGWYADWANKPNWNAVPVGGDNGLNRYGANDGGGDGACQS